MIAKNMAVSIELLSQAISATHNTGELVAPTYTIDQSTGDFYGKEHPEILDYINYCAALSIKDARIHGLENPAQEVMDTITFLETGRNNYREYVNNPDNYEPGAAERIKARYNAVDKKTEGLSPRQRLIARINSGKGIIYATDMDGTLTRDPSEYLIHVPGSGKPGSGLAEDLLEDLGRDEFVKVFAQVWQPIMRDAPDIFREAGRKATPLAGTKELFHQLHRRRIPTHIISANFLTVADEFIKKYITSVQGNIHAWAITYDSIISTDKNNVLQDIALSYPDYTVLDAGDSLSDRAALLANQYVGGYLARAGMEFEMELQKKCYPYASYQTHYDTIALLEEAEATRYI